MKWKNLAIVVAIFAALFAWVYFYEIKGEKKREEAVEKEKKIFQFEEKDIAQITVKNADGEFVLQKDKDNWKLVQPLATKADKSSADSLASDIAQAKTDRALDEPNPNFKNFGLEPAVAKLTVKLGSGTNPPVGTRRQGFQFQLSLSLASPARTRFSCFRLRSTAAQQRNSSISRQECSGISARSTKAMNILTKGKEYVLEKATDDWKRQKPLNRGRQYGGEFDCGRSGIRQG
jgi:hypothetical protein